MNRKIYYWKLRDSEIQLGERTLIMGVLNITPDSFSDGGRFNDPDRAYARALELEEQGADIIDIGAESTRPGSHRITADEEWQRLLPVLKRLRDTVRVPLSLDTYKSEIAERALDYGIQIFNDPSGLTFDPVLAKVAANGNAGLILNHMRGQPESWAKLPPMKDPVATIGRDLEATVSRARLAGVDRARIVVDPGLGFGKRKEQNSELLAKLRQLGELDYPILIGASRKSFLSQQTEADTAFATAAAVAIAAFNGAHIVRVHDVKQMQSVLLVADEIARAAGVAESAEDEEKAEPIRTAKPFVPKVRQFQDEKPRPARAPLAKAAVVAAPVVSEAITEAIPEAIPELIPEAVPGAIAELEPTAEPIAVAGEEVVQELALEVAGATPEPPATTTPFVKRESRPPSDKPIYQRESAAAKSGVSSGWGPPAKREYRSDAPRTEGPPRREFGPDGYPIRSGSRPDSGTGAPPRRDYPPRSDSRPDSRGDFRPSGPPRRDYPPRSDSRPDSRGDFRPSGPPRRDYPPRSDSRPDSRGDFRPSGPPRRDYPPRSDSRPDSRGDFRPSGPPRRDYPPRSDSRPDSRGDSRFSGPPRRDYPPRPDSRSDSRGDFRPGSRSDGPPRRDYPPRRDSAGPPPRGRDFRPGGAPPPRRDFRSDGPPSDSPRRSDGPLPRRPMRKRP